ncbi:Hypothetical predicted protein [Argonauta hians]
MAVVSVNAITKIVTRVFFVAVLFTSFCQNVHGSDGPSVSKQVISETIDKLLNHIYKFQAKKDTKGFLPFTWSHKKGIYESDVKLYFHGQPIMTLTRNMFAVYDVNMFATSWINIAMLEAYSYNKLPKPSAQNLQQSLEAISQFTDRNVNYTNSLMCFWPQVYNETVGMWQSSPRNLLQLLNFSDYLPMNFLEKILEGLGFDKLEQYIKHLVNSKSLYASAFHIPPDFDDTSVNLGLGSLLAEKKADFPEQYQTWLEHNSNITSVFDALKKYAYRPFSADKNVNSIDPRTYFYLRGFLEDAASNGKDVTLVPTWAQNINETLEMSSKGVGMPFNINNVDCAVAANTIYGITASILSGVQSDTILDDPDIQKIYRNTTALLAWQLRTRLSERSDLAIPYYPSIMEFYWFVSRITSCIERFLINNRPHKQNDVPKVIEEAFNILGVELRTNTTAHIMSLAISDTTGGIYFDGFIGNDNVTRKPEDRLFTTAMAVNALQGIWSVYDGAAGMNVWINETPPRVIETITSAVKFLHENIFGGEYKPWNAFFSGSVKGMTTLPFLYPYNRFENSSSMLRQLRAVEGLISEKEYMAMTKVPLPEFNNMTTPMEFKGFNADDSVFPFWTSEPYTYATTLLALSHYRNTAPRPTDPVAKLQPQLQHS